MTMKIQRNKVKIKNLLGVVENPIEEDLLFEIVSFLEKENRLDDDFGKTEISLKTRLRLSETIEDDLIKLINKGYLKKEGKIKYKVINHPWK